MSKINMLNERDFYLSLADLGCWQYAPSTKQFTLDCRAAEYLTGDPANNSMTLDDVLAGIHPNDREIFVEALQQSAARNFSISVQIEGNPGSWQSLNLRGDSLPGVSNGEIGGVVSKQPNSDSLNPSESELIGKIVDAIPFPVLYITNDGQVDFANKTFREVTGTNVVINNGQPVNKVLSHQERDNGTAAFMECLKGKSVSREGESGGNGKNKYYCRYVYEPVKDNSGKVVGVCTSVVDLTQIKKTQASLVQSHAELERSNRDLEQFAYIASHDLKAPLRAIDVLVGWLSEDLESDTREDVHENLDLLRQRTARMNKLLEDLLDYSRAGRQVGEVSNVECHELISDICTLLDVPDHCTIKISDTLPALTTYATPLEQVLRNLIANAIKHHPGPEAIISINAEHLDDRYIFAIADDGTGISNEFTERVFEMFQTLKPRDDMEGSGMGLAIVSRIVEWQGGRTWFEPRTDGQSGVVFKFEWLTDVHDEESTRANPERNAA